MLAHPDFSRTFKIQSDASGVALSSVLTQQNEAGEEHPIVYLSRILNKHELKYTVSEKVLLAVVWSIEKLRPYIEGYHFTVVTDHGALKWLKNLKDPTGRLARWAIKLQQWDFEIVHQKGSQHQFPDVFLTNLFSPAALQAIEEWPKKYAWWQVEKGCVYNYRTKALIDQMDPDASGWKLVVPKELKERVL